jgi:hypothetical protein
MTGDSEIGEAGRGIGADSDLNTTGVCGTGVGMVTALATGGGALNAVGAGACVGADTGAGAGGVNVDCALLNTAPFSRLTSFNVAVFPAKNSLAEREASDEAAAG